MSLSTLAVAPPAAPPLKSRRLVRKTSPCYLELLEELGGEVVSSSQRCYLVTISRVLPRVAAATGYRDLETLTRHDVEGMVRDSFDDPLPLPGTSAGRPRSREGVLVELVVVAKEAHADGSTRFHVAIKLGFNMRFGRAKLTLQERHKLPSHWSCSQTQLWSALRYLHVATPEKPVALSKRKRQLGLIGIGGMQGWDGRRGRMRTKTRMMMRTRATTRTGRGWDRSLPPALPPSVLPCPV